RGFLAMSMATSRLSATTETEDQTPLSDASPRRRSPPSITEGPGDRPRTNPPRLDRSHHSSTRFGYMEADRFAELATSHQYASGPRPAQDHRCKCTNRH